ncbi:MAG TPA: YbhB/YbcL family Raf kinase inhibitor-like protein [Solirubrobacteraceae bacterium]|jgi:hypothetical protein|nr:YbhB/YbcL family Raf kinase inhibitor-like protein [Solirubrobacteraceae bacterium]
MPHDPYAGLPSVADFTLRSDDIAHDQKLATAQLSGIFGAGGSDTSPHLAWSGAPEGTGSYVVTLYDPDAPTVSGFWHWAVFNLPASVTELASGAGDAEGSGLPAGAVTLRNDAGLRQFLGAAPPEGHGRHRYYTVVHALNVPALEVDADATPAFLSFNLLGCTVGRAMLVPWYER